MSDDEFDALRERIEALEDTVGALENAADADHDEPQPEYDRWYKFTHSGTTRYAAVLETDILAAPSGDDDHTFAGDGFAVYTDADTGSANWWDVSDHHGHDDVDREHGYWCRPSDQLTIVDASEVPDR